MPEHHHVKPITLYQREMKRWKWRTTTLVYGVPGAAREVGMTSTDAEHRILVENSLGNQPLGRIPVKSQPAE